MSDKMPETVPLFDEPQRYLKQKRSRGPRSVTFSDCPKCANLRVGLVRTGNHLVWREHTYTTWGGTSRPCTASGVAVCSLPDKARKLDCPCGGGHDG